MVPFSRNHAHVYVVGLEPGQHIFHAVFDFLDLAGAHVLIVFPDRADVGLEDKSFASPGEGGAHAGADLRVGGVEVDVVDAMFFGRVQERPGGAVLIFGKAFAAQSDLADFKSCIS